MGTMTDPRGFPVTTAYVTIVKISCSSKSPKGVIRYEWMVT